MAVVEIHWTIVATDAEWVKRACPVEVRRGTKNAQRLGPCVIKAIVQSTAPALPYDLQSIVIGISVVSRHDDGLILRIGPKLLDVPGIHSLHLGWGTGGRRAHAFVLADRVRLIKRADWNRVDVIEYDCLCRTIIHQ